MRVIPARKQATEKVCSQTSNSQVSNLQFFNCRVVLCVTIVCAAVCDQKMTSFFEGWDKNFWWRIESARSGKSKCKQCKESIKAGDARLGWETEESDHWGSNFGWYHAKCGIIASKNNKNLKAINSTNDINDFDKMQSNVQVLTFFLCFLFSLIFVCLAWLSLALIF